VTTGVCPQLCLTCEYAAKWPHLRCVAGRAILLGLACPLWRQAEAASVDVSERSDWRLCDECDHQHWPSGSARGCKLIDDGVPCSLGARLRKGGPWPESCPRRTSPEGGEAVDGVEQDVKTRYNG
jgi:hypothetical protein